MSSVCFWGVALASAAFCLTAAGGEAGKAPPSELGRLLGTPILAKESSHGEMMSYLFARIPPLKCPKDGGEWDAIAEGLRRRMLDEVVLKGHDAGVLTDKPGVEWLDTIETGKGYRIRKLRYEGYPGMWIPALLYEPTELTGKAPVVLNPNGHQRPEGKAVKYKQLRCINQAKRGMIALNPEWIAMGELRLPGYDHYELAYLDLCGQSGVGVFYMLLKRGLDVLLDHPNADPARVAVTGLSGGGWQTIFFSSLDTRVKMAVPNAGYIGQETRYQHRGDVGDLEQCPVDQLLVADYTHMTAMLAPRPALLIYNEKDNCCFVSARAKPSVFDPVVPFYKLYGKADRFGYHTNKDPGNHNYELDNRQQLYAFINDWFAPTGTRQDKEIPSDDEVRTVAELTVGVPKDNATFYTLAERAAAGLPLHPLKEPLEGAAREAWCRERREALREVLRITPTSAVLAEARELPSEAYAARALTFKTSDGWHVPAVDVAVKGRSATRVAIVAADGGRAQPQRMVESLVKDEYRVLAADLLLTGECRPVGLSAWQVEMCIGNVGGRPLGIKVAQLMALMDYAAKTWPGRPITVAGLGRVSSMAAVLAAGLNERNRADLVLTSGLPDSLKDLIKQRATYTKVPSLFSFGLLVEADVREMRALALPAKVKVIKTEGDGEGVRK
ncbi:MAG: hypothetical protein JXQ73_29890 [Phycisphaerae bacterium]|nr:hypothetical protein [Phycisphaerae bacterium]